MTSERPRFPVGLTLAAGLVFAICITLGAWQLQRGAWKAHVLAEIAARRDAPPQPVGPVLTRAARGEDVGFTRVVVQCGDGGDQSFKAGSDGSEWVWRVMARCALAGAPYSSVSVDRGILDSSRGSTTAPTTALPPLREVSGVLQPAPSSAPASQGREAPYILVAEHETPAPLGVTPNRLVGVPENLQYVGTYAPTWFGLAGVLACVYAAMLWRRSRSS